MKWLLLGLALGAVATVWGQGGVPAGDPAGLGLLRQRYEVLLQEAEAAARGRWLAALEQAERQKVAERDYAGAMVLRERRVGAAGAVAEVAGGRRPIVMRGAGAKQVSGVEFLDVKKEVARFRRQGALMEWELPGQVPGLYEVCVVCGVLGAADENGPAEGAEAAAGAPSAAAPSAAPSAGKPPAAGSADIRAGGVVEFREITNLNEGGTVLRRAVRSTGGWTKTRALSLGRVELDSKFVKFSLRGVEVLPAGLMDFLRLELVPVAAAVDSAEGGGAKGLERLKEVYQKEFVELGKGMSAKYLKELVDLEMAAGRAQDVETLALVRQEKKRLEGSGSVEEGGSHVLPVAEKLYLLMSGEARLNNQGDYLTHLRPAGSCAITWKLAGLGIASGTYAVEIVGRLGPGQGGTALLYASGAAVEAGPPLAVEVEAGKFPEVPVGVKRKPEAAPVGSVPCQIRPGKVMIPKGAQYLSLKVDTLQVADGSLFDLKSIRLTPVAPSPEVPEKP